MWHTSQSLNRSGLTRASSRIRMTGAHRIHTPYRAAAITVSLSLIPDPPPTTLDSTLL
jgi:hypothetical protein